MKWLDERNIGYPVGSAGVVPIVPAAILFDLGFGGNPKIRPGADCGYKAADAASEAPVQEGNVGAGTGATVGKSGGRGQGGGPMKAGIGSAAIRMPNGLVVAALVAVNAVGDIVDPETGQVVAGARGPDNKLLDARKILRGGAGRDGRAGENTTIGLVVTNARLTKVQAQKVAQMANDGYARTIYPVAHPRRWRHDLRGSDRHVGRRRQLRPDRRARRRRDGGGGDSRRDAGDRLERSSCGARFGNGAGAIQEVASYPVPVSSFSFPVRMQRPMNRRRFLHLASLPALSPLSRLSGQAPAIVKTNRPTLPSGITAGDVERRARGHLEPQRSGVADVRRVLDDGGVREPAACSRSRGTRIVRLHVARGPDRSAGGPADLLPRAIPGSVRARET